MDSQRLVQLVQGEVQRHFKPEFMNRLDEVIVFNKLGRDDASHIASLMLEETAARLREVRDVGLDVSPRVLGRALAEGYSEEWGVRPLRSMLVRLVDDPVCDALLRGDVGAGGTAAVELDEDGSVVVYDRDSYEEARAEVGLELRMALSVVV